MQINNINAASSFQTKPEQNNNKSNASFKGGLDSFCLSVANTIETGGLVISFTITDMLGTNFPRFFSGLTRNREENNGKLNWDFAAKEGTREFITGPSMFVIPLGLLAAAKKFFGSACEVPVKFIKAFSDIHAKYSDIKGKSNTQTEFFKNVFSEIIKNAKGENSITADTSKEAAKFAKDLSSALEDKDKNVVKSKIEDLSEKFTDIAKKNSNDAVHTDFTAAKVAGAGSSFKKTVSHMISYAQDVVEKSKSASPKEVKNFIENLADKKILGRFSLNVLMYSAVIGFLQIIPILYNKAEGDKNAGLKGLVNEEKLKNKQLNAKNKSNPSFGAKGNFAQKLAGNGKIGKISDIMEFDGCSMGFWPLAGLMGGGILYPRLKNAKDKYDREEILRRDAVTCVAMCVANKELINGFSKINEMKSGLVLASKSKEFKDKSLFGKVLDYLNPVNGVNVLSSEQIRAQYTNIGNYKDGIKGFCDFISGQGGNLSKLFSIDEEAKKIVDDLLKKEGKAIENADNETITKVLTNKNNEKEVDDLVKLFKPTKRTRGEIIEDNKWVTKARTLNSRFTTASVVAIVPIFLGAALPWYNEKKTKERIKAEKAMNENKLRMQNKSNNPVNKITNPVFAEMEKYTK